MRGALNEGAKRVQLLKKKVLFTIKKKGYILNSYSIRGKEAVCNICRTRWEAGSMAGVVLSAAFVKYGME
jgi:hypothetical protein